MPEIVVVGAGIVGASVAYYLARQGVSVTLIDQAPSPAAGVTGNSFAWIGGAGPLRLLGYAVGRRPMPEGGPIVGYVTPDKSAYVAVMHSALTLAPTVGRLIAGELINGRPAAELRRCRPQRFSTA